MKTGSVTIGFRRVLFQRVTRAPGFSPVQTITRSSRGAGLIKDWSMTTLREKLIKIGAKVVGHARYVSFQMAEVAIPRNVLADILRMIAELRPPPITSTA
jgi:hypothetical protein